jgi:hypothetical protein
MLMKAARAIRSASGALGVVKRWLGACLVCGGALAVLWPGHAFASGPAVTIPNGPFSDGEFVVVSGTGFATPAKDPSGLQLIECSDPKGLVTNLPTDPTTCDGATVNPLPVNTDSAGKFSVRYPISALSAQFGRSNIDCNATEFCVLWVGVDYNQAFRSGTHAFSAPFEVDAPAAAVSGGAIAAPVTSPSPNGATASPTRAGGPVPVSTAASGGTLASTGLPGGLWWIVGLGAVTVLSGSLCRRLAARPSR